MSKINREDLSAFMDGELKDGSGRDVIDHLLEDEASRHTWMRYHLIAETMRHSLPAHLDPQLTASISTRLQDEPTALRPTGKKLPAYLKPAAGLAIAASVASVAILGVQQQGQKTIETGVGGSNSGRVAAIQPNIPAERQFRYPAPRPASIDNTASATTGRPAAVPAGRNQGFNSRLNNYLINYNEYHANAGMQGMLPYVRIVAHDRHE